MRVSDERVVDGRECVAAVFLGHENAFRIGVSRKNSVTGAESEPLQKGVLCPIVPSRYCLGFFSLSGRFFPLALRFHIS